MCLSRNESGGRSYTRRSTHTFYAQQRHCSIRLEMGHHFCVIVACFLAASIAIGMLFEFKLMLGLGVVFLVFVWMLVY